MWRRENLPGIAFDRPWKWLLLPGLVIQWIHYMFPSGSLSSVAGSARQANSQIITYLYSAAFYAVLFGICAGITLKGSY
jgi:hypothetical protein